MIDPVLLTTLRQCRAGVYRRFGGRRDALFDLLDAALVAGPVPSLAHLVYLDTFIPRDGQAQADLLPPERWERMQAVAQAEGDG